MKVGGPADRQPLLGAASGGKTQATGSFNASSTIESVIRQQATQAAANHSSFNEFKSMFGNNLGSTGGGG